MDYIQLLFSFFNAPLFATFIIGMFWKRMTPWAGFWGLVAGTIGAAAAHYGNSGTSSASARPRRPRSGARSRCSWPMRSSRVVRHVVHAAEAHRGAARPVHGMANEAEALSREEQAWYRKPSTLAIGVLGIVLVLSIIFW